MGDYRTTTGEPAPLPPAERKKRRWQWAGWIGLIALLAVLAGGMIRVEERVWASGYILTETYAEVRSPVQGIVAAIHARSGDVVEAGAVLVQLDDADALAALEEARSRLRQLEAVAARREAEIAERRRRRELELEAAELRLRGLDARLQRLRELQARGLAAAAVVEEATLQRALAETEWKALQLEEPSALDRELEAVRHEVEAGREIVARAESQWRQRRLVAPIAGTVIRSDFAAGELVRPDQVLYEIYGGRPSVLKVQVDERYAARIRPGQRYEATLTPYGGWSARRFRGRVVSRRDVIQTDGQRTYRTVYCEFDPGDADVPPGTTAEVRILTGRSRLWQWVLGLY